MGPPGGQLMRVRRGADFSQSHGLGGEFTAHLDSSAEAVTAGQARCTRETALFLLAACRRARKNAVKKWRRTPPPNAGDKKGAPIKSGTPSAVNGWGLSGGARVPLHSGVTDAELLSRGGDAGGVLALPGDDRLSVGSGRAPHADLAAMRAAGGFK